MNTISSAPGASRVAGSAMPMRQAHVIPVVALGMALSLFLSVSYVLCVLG